MNDLVNKINIGLGGRLRQLKRNEDDYQIFWVGVLEALPEVDENRDPIPFLILRGMGAVRNTKRSEMSKDLLRSCCGKTYGFRTNICPVCGQEMPISRRKSEYQDIFHGTCDSVIEQITIEQFVNSLSDNKQYVAKRWLLDRVDLTHINHCKQIAFELGISGPAVAKHKKNIRKSFMEWYYG